jgi:tripartite-type tricarboxylate transporter receptor subunit TctC
VRPPLRRFLRLAAVAVAALSSMCFSCHGALSQAARVIKIVVAVPAAGPGDIAAHLFADQMRQAFIRAHGPMIEIETRTIGGGTIGAEYVSRAAPDGDTLLMTTTAFIINAYLGQRVGYDPLTSFAPVCYLARTPQVIVVNSATEYRTLADLLNAARNRPGDLTMASFGPYGSSHIAVEMLKLATNVNISYIPFRSQVTVANALLDERVTSAITSYKDVSELLKDGKLRALATTSRTRFEQLPDVPTVAESGYKDYEGEVRLWLLAPAATPKATISQLAGWFTAAMQAPEVKSELAVRGLYPVGLCGADAVVLLRKQYDEIGRTIREGSIK